MHLMNSNVSCELAQKLISFELVFDGKSAIFSDWVDAKRVNNDQGVVHIMD